LPEGFKGLTELETASADARRVLRRSLLFGSLGYCVFATGAQLRLIVLQALLCLLALLTLAQLLELRFARLGNLAIDLTTLGLRLHTNACEKGRCDQDK
jgi:hypothetical protein